MSSDDLSPSSWDLLLAQTPHSGVTAAPLGSGKDVCGGKIRSAMERFCTAPCEPGKDMCRFSSHSHKSEVVGPAYYIRAVKGTSAFCEPVLLVPENGFSEVIIESLKGKRTPEEWARLFPTLLTASSLSINGQIDMISRGDRNVAYGPTPVITRIPTESGQLNLDRVDLFGESGDAENESQDSGGGYDQAIADDTLQSEYILEHIADCWNNVIGEAVRQKKLLKEFESGISSVIEEVDDKVVQVGAALGQKPKGTSLPLTLWSAVTSINGAVENLSTKLEGSLVMVTDKMKSAVDQAVEVKGIMERTIIPRLSSLTTSVRDIQNGSSFPSAINKGVENEVNNLKKAQNVIILELNKTKVELNKQASRTPNPDTETASLRILIEDLRVQIESRDRMYAHNQHAGHGQLESDQTNLEVREFMAEVAVLRDQVSYLSLENVKLQAEMNTDTITFGGYHFTSTDSYTKFVSEHVKNGYYGFCFDFISLTESASDQNRTTHEGLKNLKAIAGAGFENPNEAIVFASFGTNIPKMFGIDHDIKDPAKKMGSMTTHKEWDPKTNRAGRKNEIHNALTSFKQTINMQIKQTYGQQSVATLFFQNLLQSTWSFWEAYAAWITRFEDEMCCQIAGDDPAAHKAYIWNLICWLTHSMFSELVVRRAAGGVAAVLDKSDKTAICAAILQGTLGAHTFMNELVDKNFNRHPLFAAAMAEFLMTTKAPMITVEALSVKLKAVESLVRGLQGTNDRRKQGQAGGGN